MKDVYTSAYSRLSRISLSRSIIVDVTLMKYEVHKGYLQNKYRSYFVFSRQFSDYRPPPTLCLQNLKKWAHVFPEMVIIGAIFGIFEDNYDFAAAPPPPVSKRQNMSDFFLQASLMRYIICNNVNLLLSLALLSN